MELDTPVRIDQTGAKEACLILRMAPGAASADGAIRLEDAAGTQVGVMNFAGAGTGGLSLAPSTSLQNTITPSVGTTGGLSVVMPSPMTFIASSRYGIIEVLPVGTYDIGTGSHAGLAVGSSSGCILRPTVTNARFRGVFIDPVWVDTEQPAGGSSTHMGGFALQLTTHANNTKTLAITYGSWHNLGLSGGVGAVITDVYGFRVTGGPQVSVAVTTLNSFAAEMNAADSSATTTWRQFYGTAPTGGGTITNLYGLHIANLAPGGVPRGTNTWAIRTEGGQIEFGGAGDIRMTGSGKLLRWEHADNQQTTVGPAGGASALPATPTTYLKVKDSAGTTLVVPAYAATAE